MKITPRVRAYSARFCLLLVILVGLCTSAAVHARSAGTVNTTNSTTSTDCDQVRKFLHSNNITFVPTVNDSPNTICGSKCCSEEIEKQLKQQSRAKFHTVIHHHSKTLQGLLDTTAKVVRGTVIALLRKSENKTLTMFDQVYRSMAVQSRPSIRALYQALVDYVSPANTPDNLQQPVSREMLQERFAEFFTQLFPIAYHNTINPEQDQQDFTDKFKACLNETMEDVQPFGDVPQEIFKQIGKSLEATRVLVQALTVGKTVLEKTDSVLFTADSNSLQQEACYDVLLRMTYCARCQGIKSVRPCIGFCINVIRGCLTEPTFELDLAWSGYVEAVERLVAAIDSDTNSLGLNLKEAIRKLDSRISDAIMHAMENGPQLEEKVRKVCGRSELLPPGEKSLVFSDAAAKSTAPLSAHATVLKNVPHGDLMDDLHKQLGNFLASVVRSRIFYGTLAETVCEEYGDTHCWNGERVGEYTKTVVDISPNAQRYNPEFTVTMMSTPATYAGNTNTSALIDQLRHINQVVQSQLATSPDGGAFLADEALEGSGSGDSPVWRSPGRTEDDEDVNGDDRDDDEASGSGMGPSTTDTPVNTNPNLSVSGSSTILLSSVILVIACASLIA